jgi:hypothetical protein
MAIIHGWKFNNGRLTFVRPAWNQKKIVTNKTQTKQEKHTENSIHLKLN